MELSKVLAVNIKRYKLEHGLSIVELAEELHLALSTTQEYVSGRGNPRGDTLELLAQRMGVPVARLVSLPDTGQGPPQVRRAVRTARELAGLPQDKRERGLELLQELAELFAGA